MIKFDLLHSNVLHFISGKRSLHDYKFSFFFVPFQLSEIVNSLSPQGQLPLQLALIGRSSAIAQTLVQTGGADINAYDGEGSTLLIDSIKRGDGFSAQFLLDKKCNVNLTTRNTNDTALHIICTYSEKTCDAETYKSMLEIGKQLLQDGADSNLQNTKG